MEYEELKQICLAMADKIAQFEPQEIVAVVRGGLTPAHIIAKKLRLNISFFIPETQTWYSEQYSNRVAIIEDVVALGRTYQTVANVFSNITYKFCPVVVDYQYNATKFDIYGIKAKQWVVFPYEELTQVKIGDRGLFRKGTDAYAT